ncbi:MAG TPA: hypothetical protein VFN09_04770, partial [Rhodanobacteraceae bacterium]|nr:hypothetical protein [Rhodanobacteraceae bacterium]
TAMMKMTHMALLLAFAAPCLALAGGPPPASTDSVSVDGIIAYLDDLASQQAEIQQATAQIQSHAELARYLTSTPAERSPLSKLSAPARQRFLSSITFNEHGITGFSYADLAAELTPTEISAILRLFGAERTVPLMKNAHISNHVDSLIMHSPYLMPSEDHEGYACDAPGDCVKMNDHICTHNC